MEDGRALFVTIGVETGRLTGMDGRGRKRRETPVLGIFPRSSKQGASGLEGSEDSERDVLLDAWFREPVSVCWEDDSRWGEDGGSFVEELPRVDEYFFASMARVCVSKGF